MMSSTQPCEKNLTVFHTTYLPLYLRDMDLIDKPKVVVISLMFKWRPVANGISQELELLSVTGAVYLWAIEMEFTFSTFANNTKQCGAVNTLEGRQITLIVSNYSYL